MQPLVEYDKEWNRRAADYKSKTSPLSAEVVQDLCNKLDLPAQDWRCQPQAIVYAPEFFDDIKSYLRNLPRTSSNQAEVDALLGDYKIQCSTPQQYRYTSVAYDCLYDIHGDSVSIIAVDFTKDGTIEHVSASTGGS
ncbi:MAG: hypothetical protein JW987_03120 [Anaerolineaceae bacterium]|nr:hypothetical protein [Anaerolineaceae bacterium]